jgi:hypothetical protein
MRIASASFGLSYGGFLTLQALNDDPTLWRAGVERGGRGRLGDVRLRLHDAATGHAGAESGDLQGARRQSCTWTSSSGPLLVLHGTNDRNVSFADSLRLFDVLIKLGKPFESQIYPGEIHFFRRDMVLREAWRRIEEFFDRTVKNGPVMASNNAAPGYRGVEGGQLTITVSGGAVRSTNRLTMNRPSGATSYGVASPRSPPPF